MFRMKNSGKPKKKVSRKTSRKRKHSVKRISEIMDDDNTTNSETSEQPFFSDINWEENLEVDTTSLLEEFAPQTLPKKSVKPPVKLSDPPAGTKNKCPEEKVSFNELEMCDIESPSDFHINLKLLILHYKTNQWVEAVVDEIDQDEEEVLVRYDGSFNNSEEWLSMKSQRIKKKKLQTSSQVFKLVDPSCTPQAVSSPDEVLKSNVPVLPEVPAQSSPPVGPTPTAKKSKLTKKKTSIKKLRRSIKKPPYKKTAVLSNKNNSRRALQIQDRKTSRRLPVWKSHMPASSKGAVQEHSNSVIKITGKFSEGEKVLAKWSDHRMQKFPAVIKKVCGDGYYDVLFYDGFEKTIVEDNIYKTTEEEVAKYKESKPSEADSFVDVDLASRQERRQKKRKTFNDFFEEKDFKRSKKSETFDLNRSESFQRASVSRNKPSLQSFSVHSKRNSVGSPKPATTVGTPKSSPASTPPQTLEIKEPEKNAHTLTNLMNEPSNLPAELVKNLPPILCKKVEEKQVLKKVTSKSLQLSHLQYPLEITCHDGVIRKSILIDDEKLPPGWTKHVIAWVENAWACFLFTPDKYAVHSLIELKKYFRISEGQDPPEGLDFSFPKDCLQDVMDSQKDLVPKCDYRKWVNKILDERKIMKKVRILPPSRTIGPGSHLSTKRVRTLLPKHRSHTLNPSASNKPLEGKVWRCPKSECAKKFRKENLLHMHIKHYHRELSELAESAPKVVDLALARTSADGTFTSEVPPKRPASKSPLYDHTLDKNSEKSNSIQTLFSEVAVPQQKPGTAIRPSTPQPGPSHITLQTPPPPGISSSLKVLTPLKQTKPKIENDPEVKDVGNEFSDKSRTHGTPKLSLKKHIESKTSDDIAYLTGSRSLKKKQQPSEKTVNTELFANESNDLFMKDDLRDEEGFDRLQSEEIINCLCGFKEEDGLMVQCEVCLCWQHGSCHGMERDSDVPERYVCAICLNPLNVRSSQRYSYANHYLTLSRLPKFKYRTYKEETFQHRQSVLSRSFELSSTLQSIHTMKRSLSAKINIAQHSDHPKLYLWSQNWDSSKKKHVQPYLKRVNADSHGRRGPVGEAPIESEDCRLRLLDSIEEDQQDIESRLTIVQAQIQALESDDFDVEGEEEEGGGGGDEPLLKQAIYMLIRDLNTVATAAKLS